MTMWEGTPAKSDSSWSRAFVGVAAGGGSAALDAVGLPSRLLTANNGSKVVTSYAQLEYADNPFVYFHFYLIFYILFCWCSRGRTCERNRYCSLWVGWVGEWVVSGSGLHISCVGSNFTH